MAVQLSEKPLHDGRVNLRPEDLMNPSAPMISSTFVTVTDQQVRPLFRDIFPPAFAPGLSLLGLPFKVVPFPQHELQAKLVARVLSGKAVLPNRKQMEREMLARDEELIISGVPSRHFHMQGDSQWVYNDGIAALCGLDVEQTPSWRVKMYAESGS